MVDIRLADHEAQFVVSMLQDLAQRIALQANEQIQARQTEKAADEIQSERKPEA